MVDYLRDRQQCVVIGGQESDYSHVVSSVPQRSILRSLLLVMFINDLMSCIIVGTKIALYADDTKIWREIIDWNDHLTLQSDINSLFH